MRKFAHFVAAALISLLIAPPQSQAADAEIATASELVLSTPTDEGVFTVYLKDVFQELGNRTGVKFTIEEYPKQRALVEADKGQVDGVAARIRGLKNLGHPNLEMIDVSHFAVQHVVFAKRRDILENVKDAHSLIDGASRLNFNVAYLRGSKKARLLLADMPEENKLVIDNPDDAFMRIQYDRLGAFLGGPGIVSRALLKEKYKGSGIEEVVVLSETELFAYLHKKHARLIPKIEQALRSMEDDGTLEKIRGSLE